MGKEKKVELYDVQPGEVAIYDLYVLLMEQSSEISEIREMIVALPKVYPVWELSDEHQEIGEQTK